MAKWNHARVVKLLGVCTLPYILPHNFTSVTRTLLLRPVGCLSDQRTSIEATTNTFLLSGCRVFRYIFPSAGILHVKANQQAAMACHSLPIRNTLSSYSTSST
eukprot:Em0002g1295a